MKELTRAEEQIMQIVWRKGEVFVNDVIAELPEPKPAYNTVSTIIRILESKEFIGHKVYGKSHQYHPLVTKKTYTRGFLNRFVGKYFSNSYKNMVSFFSKEQNLSVNELEEMIQLLQEKLDQQKKK